MHGNKSMILSLLTGLKQGLSGVDGVKVAVCPPALYVDYAAKVIGDADIALGAQNMAKEPVQGAFTGEVSSEMLNDLGCSYVILGHSERRALFGETDADVAEKVQVALDAGITPILCVGETLEEREAGQAESVIKQQLDAVLEKVGVEAFEDIVIAYEPVWAIGTGKTASPEQAQEIHAFIRSEIAKLDSEVAQKVIIQYGGSVKPDNAESLFSQPDIDGGLIGGASLSAPDFIAICKAAGK
jgi:triosephosphate isomerase